MTPVSPFLRHYAGALLAGATLATCVVNLSPETFYDLLEWHLFDSSTLAYLRIFYPVVTPATLVTTLLLPFFVFLIGKELWEAVLYEKGGLHGRKAFPPTLMLIGGLIGSILAWQLGSAFLQDAEEAIGTPGWVVPIGSDVVICFFFARIIFGPGHPALQLLFFLTIGEAIVGLLFSGLAAPIGEALRPQWLLLPLGASLLGYITLTRSLKNPLASEVARQRASQLWPWMVLGLISWLGVCAAGLPPALGLLPILPALPHGHHSFGLFAEAEGLLNDTLNRIAHSFLAPMIGVMFLFGLTHAGLDLGAFGPTTVIVLLAFWVGKPLGLLMGAIVARKIGHQLPKGILIRDIIYISGLMGMGYIIPALTIETALPGGAVQEAARLGLACTVLVGPIILLSIRLRQNNNASEKV